MKSLREAAMWVWESFINLPYIWRGDDFAGVDCSGLVLEGLKATGIVPRDFDTTADGLLTQTFKDATRITNQNHFRRGALVFWGSPVRHVEIVWAVFPGLVLTLGASGGGSATVDRAAAVKSNAYVKVRPCSPNWVAAVDPFQDAPF